MGNGYDKKEVGEDDYYVIQDTTMENNTTGKNVTVCKPTTFKII